MGWALSVLAWLIVTIMAVTVLGFSLITFIAALLGGGSREKYYDDEDDAYIVMPDGTIRFDTGGLEK